MSEKIEEKSTGECDSKVEPPKALDIVPDAQLERKIREISYLGYHYRDGTSQVIQDLVRRWFDPELNRLTGRDPMAKPADLRFVKGDPDRRIRSSMPPKSATLLSAICKEWGATYAIVLDYMAKTYLKAYEPIVITSA